MVRCFSFFLMILAACSLKADDDICGNNEEAKKLVELIKNDKGQKRANIRCNKLLSKVALDKAKTMLDYGLVIHNLGGSPNSRLREANYELPDYYGNQLGSNQVEAIAGGYSDADSVWEAFKSSDAHRSHLLGEHELYLEQDEIGVAFIKERQSPHVEYWTVYLTKGYSKNQSKQNDFDEIPNKSIYILQNPNKRYIKVK